MSFNKLSFEKKAANKEAARAAREVDAALENPDEITPTGHCDTTFAGRKVYLLKLPEFLLTHLQQSATESNTADPIVAKLKLPNTMDDDAENALKGSIRLLPPKPMQSGSTAPTSSTHEKKERPRIPQEYEVKFLPEAPRTLLFSEEPADDKGRMRVEGRVSYHCVAQPVLDEAYLAVNQQRYERASKRNREVALMDDRTLRTAQVDELRPLINVESVREREEKRRRAELMKRGSDAPMDAKWKDTTVAKLFGLFERKPYWGIKALLDETNESMQRIKPLITELCVYNKRGPYAQFYELKDEYKTKRQRDEKDEDVNARRRAQMEAVRQKLQEMKESNDME
uniref:TFIIF beta subunit HTH domain-containing protein n=1 Tax=Timspurckia oligopyrenoides TaxID=708627 RepID=A0A7S0ZJL6_9RHOD|mmetsp:Transcript_7895/g.14320  ORF Transcript_7895/g.14320 Transcript_7895/m.14320 type:complete len:341 (+) Transcript_7895:33-1055(+)